MPDALQPPRNLVPVVDPPVVTALVVASALADAITIAAALGSLQFRVTIAETFAKAKERLNTRPPHLLIADVRLGEYNGLQLVLRAKSLRPDAAAIVTSSTADAVLQADAEAMGATFVVTPVNATELTAVVLRTMFQTRAGQTDAPIRPRFERRAGERRAAAVAVTADRRRRDRRRDLDALIRVLAQPRSASSGDDETAPGR
jgi:DNA-binding NtrC family response regulator